MAYEFLDQYTDRLKYEHEVLCERIKTYFTQLYTTEDNEIKERNYRIIRGLEGEKNGIEYALRMYLLTVLARAKFRSQRYYAATILFAIDPNASIQFNTDGTRKKIKKPKVSNSLNQSNGDS